MFEVPQSDGPHVAFLLFHLILPLEASYFFADTKGGYICEP
jgi:hypothetical protein